MVAFAGLAALTVELRTPGEGRVDKTDDVTPDRDCTGMACDCAVPCAVEIVSSFLTL